MADGQATGRVEELQVAGVDGELERPPLLDRVSKQSPVKQGGPLKLAVDTRYLQFFDPASGLSIGHPLAAAGLAES